MSSDLIDAFDRLAKAYKGGGIAGMALKMGMRAGTLRAALKPPEGSTAKLGFDEAIEIMRNCQQIGMADALAPLDLLELEFSRQAVPLPEGDIECVESAARANARMSREFADVLEVSADALADGKVSTNEFQAFDRQAAEMVAALQNMRRCMRAMCEQSKPAHLRAA
jgi:hypothetical protein